MSDKPKPYLGWGIGHHGEADVNLFLEAAEEHGIIAVDEEEELRRRRAVDEARSVEADSLLIALSRLDGSLEDAVDVMQRLDKATHDWKQKGKLEGMDPKDKAKIVKALKKVEYNLGRMDTLTTAFMREVSPRLKK